MAQGSRGAAARKRAPERTFAEWVAILQGDTLDWQEFLDWLAPHYGGKAKAGLILHDYTGVQRGELFASAGVEKRFIDKYAELAQWSVWKGILYSYPQGEIIIPSDRHIEDRKDEEGFKRFVLEWMFAQGIFHGLGAVLYKDKEYTPDHAVAIGIVRPDGEGEGVGKYTETEIFELKVMAPFLERHILQHPYLEQIIKNVTPSFSVDDVKDRFEKFLQTEAKFNKLTARSAADALLEFLAREKASIISISSLPAAEASDSEITAAYNSSPPVPEFVPPNTAPELWKNRDQALQETPATFIQRVYAPWLGEGLRRAHIGKLDRELGEELRRYLRHHQLPQGMDLPSQKRGLHALPKVVFDGDTVTVTISHPDAKERARALRSLGNTLNQRDPKPGHSK